MLKCGKYFNMYAGLMKSHTGKRCNYYIYRSAWLHDVNCFFLFPSFLYLATRLFSFFDSHDSSVMLLNSSFLEKNVSNIDSPLFSIARQLMMKFCSYMYILLSLHQSTTDMIAHYMYIHITLLLCNLIHVYLQNFIAMKILLTTTNTSRIL